MRLSAITLCLRFNALLLALLIQADVPAVFPGALRWACLAQAHHLPLGRSSHVGSKIPLLVCVSLQHFIYLHAV